MDNQHSQASQGEILQLMIAEYEALREARRLSYTVSSNSSNLFLAAVSGAIIALGLICQVSALSQFFLASVAILFGLFIVGVCTFARTLEGQIVCRLYLRGMNKIRRYFVEVAPNDVKDYMILPIYDDEPAFCSAGTNPWKCMALFVNPPGVVATINSIIGSVLITGILEFLFDLSMLCTICCFAVVFIAMLIAHQTYQVWRLKKAEEKGKKKVHFPSP